MMDGEAERLQKVLARRGVASRRAAEQLIAAGRVAVNGQVVTELGTKVDPRHDRIAVDGELLATAEEVDLVIYLLHKPVGVVSTASDPQGRPTVVELVPPQPRVYPVGRLDFDSDGLMLLTNDGDLAQRLMHPRHEVEKEYEAWVRGHPSATDLAKLRHGLLLEGETRPTAPARVYEVTRRGGETLLRFIIHEGRNRQVRRMAEAVGLHVLRLKRTRLGPLTLGDLQPGKWRRLAPAETRALGAALHGQAEGAASGPRKPAARRGKIPSNQEQEHHGARTTADQPRPGRRHTGTAGTDERRQQRGGAGERGAGSGAGRHTPRRSG